jgi:hypothetical protein
MKRSWDRRCVRLCGSHTATKDILWVRVELVRLDSCRQHKCSQYLAYPQQHLGAFERSRHDGHGFNVAPSRPTDPRKVSLCVRSPRSHPTEVSQTAATCGC